MLNKPSLIPLATTLALVFVGAGIALPANALPDPSAKPAEFSWPTQQTLSPLVQAALNGPPICADTPDGASCAPSPSLPNTRVGTSCVDLGEVYRCRVECWQWKRAVIDAGCRLDSGQDRLVAAVGVYFCPPKGVHEACDLLGEPTNGVSHARGYHTRDINYYGCPSSAVGSMAWTWSPDFIAGRPNVPNGGAQQFCSWARLIESIPEGSGTFGAYYEYYAA